ncbi:MAG: MFS transporter [Betaproteobacteria bacterium]|nr:MFS transporter [Betaproteobacteria bacterium]
MSAPVRAEDLTPLRRWGTFLALMAVYVFYAFCWNTENFLRPFMAESLRLSKEEVAAFYSLQGLGALIGALILPQLADRFSRRTTFVLLAIGFGIASIGSLAVQTYTQALAQRFVMGFFLGGVFGCAVSLYVGLFPPAIRGLLAGLVQLFYNGGDALLSWFGRHYAEEWRFVMVVGGVSAIVAAVVAFLVVPDDRRLIPWGGESSRAAVSKKLALVELFENGYWKITLRLALLCGLNFFAFQAFNGWITTYLRELHGFNTDQIGKSLTVLHVGSMVGAIVWGLLADRLGRRFNALGFLLAGIFIFVYLNVPHTLVWLSAAGFAYGFCLVASGVWGPYFAELYPEHLRATAASIFNWGRIVSLFGAIIAGSIAQRFGLTTIMGIGGGIFFLGALLWWTLPETLPSRRKA